MKKGSLALAILCASLACQANDYFFKPVFRANQGYNSNINLIAQKNNPQGSWVSKLSPGLNFGFRHENGELKSNFTWNQLFYTDQSQLNTGEQLFSMGYQYKSERLQWGANGFFNNQASFNSESTGTVLGGQVLTNIMAKQLSLAPTVTYALNELSSLSFDYSYNKTTYEKNTNNIFLSDYDYHQVSGTFSYLYTERDKLNATLTGSRYKIALRDQPTYNEVAQLGWQHSFTEQLVTYVSAGVNYSQTSITVPSLYLAEGLPVYFNPDTLRLTLVPIGLPVYLDPDTGLGTPIPQTKDVDSNNFGQVYQASIQKTFERGSVSLVGSQNQTPTSQGLQTSTSIATNNTYRINERWTSSLSANYSRNETPGQQNSPFNRTNFTINPGINWKWTPEINLGLSYTFRHQEFQNSTQGNAQGNIVLLQISYQPQINNQVK